MEGWIKLHRSSLEHWLYTEYRPLTRREAWETILLSVNYETAKTLIRGQIYECGPGQSLLSLESWAKKFVWSVQQVRTFFKLLEADGMIATEGMQYTTRLTVCNWATYQEGATDEKQTDNMPLTDRQQAANKPLTTIKEREERKERKEDKEIIKSADLYKKFISEIPEEWQQTITEWLDYKKSIKDTYKNEISLKKLFEHVRQLSGYSPETAAKIINQSIANNWKGLFELKNNQNGTNQQTSRPASSNGFSRPGYDPNNGIGNGERLSSKKRPVTF